MASTAASWRSPSRRRRGRATTRSSARADRRPTTAFGIFSAAAAPTGGPTSATPASRSTRGTSTPPPPPTRRIYIPQGNICADVPPRHRQRRHREMEKATKIGSRLGAATTPRLRRPHRGVRRLGRDGGVEFVYMNNDLPFGLPNGLGPEVTAMKDSRRRLHLDTARPEQHEHAGPGTRAPGHGRRRHRPPTATTRSS